MHCCAEGLALQCLSFEHSSANGSVQVLPMTTMYVQMYTTFLNILLSGCWCLHLEKFNHVHVYPLPIPLSLSSSFSVFSSVLGGRVLYVCERVEEGGGVAQSCGLSAGAVLPIF